MPLYHVHWGFDVKVRVSARKSMEDALEVAAAAARAAIARYVKELEKKGLRAVVLRGDIEGHEGEKLPWGVLKVRYTVRKKYRFWEVRIFGVFYTNLSDEELSPLAVAGRLVLGRAASIVKLVGREWLRRVLSAIASAIAKLFALLSFVWVVKEVLSKVVEVVVEEAAETVRERPGLALGVLALALLALTARGGRRE